MTDPTQPAAPNAARPQSNNDNNGGLFREPKREERSFPTAAVGIAVVAVLLVLAGVLLFGRHPGAGAGAPDALQPMAAYAGNLKLTNLAMSESTSFSGGKSTFVDGRITNAGPATVTGITAQVLFTPEGGGAPQMQTVPLSLIRTRQPYVDTQPVSAAPLAPGANAEFRLIFEGIRPEWNQQAPEIHLVEISTR